jgi:hypothetical protein
LGLWGLREYLPFTPNLYTNMAIWRISACALGSQSVGARDLGSSSILVSWLHDLEHDGVSIFLSVK